MTGATDGFGGRHTVGGQTLGGSMAPSHSGCMRPSTHRQVQAALAALLQINRAALLPVNRSISANRIERMRPPTKSILGNCSVQNVTQEPDARIRMRSTHPMRRSDRAAQERFAAGFVFLDLFTSGGRNMVTEVREQGNLIGSDKVEGTAVYGADRTKIGSIERVMIDKQSGKVSYAVLSFGGFLGIGDDHYPLPWQSLKYDTSLGGYVTGVTETQLKGAPKYGNDNAWNWSDATRTRAVNDYYGIAI
jgi:hypothetical protein